jgi:nucleoside-diphosphate-sugar epimerase
MDKILISGYTGFIGTNLTKRLKGVTLYGIDIQKNNSVQRHYSWEEIGECLDYQCIIHLAGKAHDTENTTSEKEYFDINVGLTQIIFQHFLKSTASKFIFFSSVKAVTDSIVDHHLTEETLPNPKSIYGRSKLEAEKYILCEFEKWKDKETANGNNCDWKKVYILRPCMIHGPGNKGNLNLLFKLQQKGLPWPLGAFENRRSFCSIENILFVIDQMITSDIEPGTYNVADDESISTNQLIQLIANSLNKKVRIWKIPRYIVKLLVRIAGKLRLPINKEKLNKLTESYIVSNQKLKDSLGIKSMPCAALDGMKLTIISFIEELEYTVTK